MNTIQELIDFNNACDEFVAGKYILVDIKIGSILNIINSDEKIKSIISDAISDYDFNARLKEFIVSTDKGYHLSMPTNDDEIIAFVYCLLTNFKNNDLDFYQFLAKLYNKEDEINNKDFNNFASTIMIPFKNAINTLYSRRHVIVDSNEYQDNYYNKIKTTVRLIVDNIDNFKLKLNEKEEFIMLLNSLHIASEKNDKKLVFSLMIGLDYFSKCNKRTRNAYLSLEECFE
ncbi:MAG: hypothetical protein IKC49_00745 [Clostridia bacterium]|nr:hypothetical protein [Clostridia bacterium]